jgi:hypothetical protein
MCNNNAGQNEQQGPQLLRQNTCRQATTQVLIQSKTSKHVMLQTPPPTLFANNSLQLAPVEMDAAHNLTLLKRGIPRPQINAGCPIAKPI